MNFYRCQSHLFPYVRAVTNNWRLKDTKHLVLQFWGNENFPSTAVPFEIKYQDELQEKKRSPEDLLFLEGIFLDEHDEEQKIEDVQFIPLSADGGPALEEENGDETKTTLKEKSSEWVIQWKETNIDDVCPFQVIDLTFNEDDTQILTGTGKADLDEVDITCSLTPVPLSAEENEALNDLFDEEKHFKLKFDLP